MQIIEFAECSVCGKRQTWDTVNFKDWEFSDEVENLIADSDRGVRGLELDCVEKLANMTCANVGVRQVKNGLRIEKIDAWNYWIDQSQPFQYLVGRKYKNENIIKAILEQVAKKEYIPRINVQFWVVA